MRLLDHENVSDLNYSGDQAEHCAKTAQARLHWFVGIANKPDIWCTSWWRATSARLSNLLKNWASSMRNSSHIRSYAELSTFIPLESSIEIWLDNPLTNPETEECTGQLKLRSQNLRLRSRPSWHPWTPQSQQYHDWLRRHSLVPSPWNPTRQKELHQS